MASEQAKQLEHWSSDFVALRSVRTYLSRIIAWTRFGISLSYLFVSFEPTYKSCKRAGKSSSLVASEGDLSRQTTTSRVPNIGARFDEKTKFNMDEFLQRFR